MNRILVIPRDHCPTLPVADFWPFSGWGWPAQFLWLDRRQAEQDEGYLQLIPYAVITDAEGRIWGYRRTGGDQRLADRLSCGVGGHVDDSDAEADLSRTILQALRREVAEELGWKIADLVVPAPQVWIYEGLSPIGRVHLGLVFHLIWPTSDHPPNALAGEALTGIGFLERTAILDDDRFELWSRLAVNGIFAARSAR